MPIDEATFCNSLGKAECKRRLNIHWSTWITESDFQEISEAGLNTVRIPIGYWAYNLTSQDPYIDGQAAYLEKAVKWASKYGLGVVLDLHGPVLHYHCALRAHRGP